MINYEDVRESFKKIKDKRETKFEIGDDDIEAIKSVFIQWKEDLVQNAILVLGSELTVTAPLADTEGRFKQVLDKLEDIEIKLNKNKGLTAAEQSKLQKQKDFLAPAGTLNELLQDLARLPETKSRSAPVRYGAMFSAAAVSGSVGIAVGAVGGGVTGAFISYLGLKGYGAGVFAVGFAAAGGLIGGSVVGAAAYDAVRGGFTQPCVDDIGTKANDLEKQLKGHDQQVKQYMENHPRPQGDQVAHNTAMENPPAEPIIQRAPIKISSTFADNTAQSSAPVSEEDIETGQGAPSKTPKPSSRLTNT